ncbi:NAD(P)-binding protein [Trematosphaeria pertusa]|uniref:NAD(P)-binding protein n=1 Tax=Trematosphaeria pertusa TaxID=390896 RepID=A0A6A6I1Z1_9PLEO|nr:NAD(P)-binding protein [Trematosphaeria pertusa]KAF2243992.1 NAD(P)-binding protein [Trematosphaeria pertusa]
MASFRTTGVALVTGAASGIGRGAANALAEAGARAIVFADIDEAGAAKASDESRKFATNPEYQTRAYALDVTDPKRVDAVIKETYKEFGRIDYLVNSAGIDTLAYAAIPDNDMDDYERVMATNARGMLLCSRAAVKVMEKQEPRTFATKLGATRDLGRGTIINVTSVLSYAAVPGKVAYIASKHAALGITKGTAQDAVGKGIRVNAVCPAWVNTAIHEAERKKFPPVQDFVKAASPLGRPAEPEEVGEGVVYLCSPAASYVNGIGLIIDAGLTLTVHLGI